jgi:hypothetical protein
VRLDSFVVEKAGVVGPRGALEVNTKKESVCPSREGRGGRSSGLKELHTGGVKAI